jgi:hypothetical protein
MLTMGAGPWTFYNTYRKHIGDASINLGSDIFMMSLYQSSINGSNAGDVTMEAIEEITGEVADGFGYVAGGQQLQNVLWEVGSTADEMRFTADTASWQALGGNIVGIRYAVVWRKGAVVGTDPNYLLCFAMVDENGDMTVPDGNPFVIAPNVGGIFELN